MRTGSAGKRDKKMPPQPLDRLRGHLGDKLESLELIDTSGQSIDSIDEALFFGRVIGS